MARFISIPPLKIRDNGFWELADRLVYQSDVAGFIFVVPEGFETDLASIPKPLRAVISVNGGHRAAAIVHDYLYSIVELKSFTRKQCDDVFLEAMKVSGVPWWKRYSMYCGVRAGGWLFWSGKS